MSAWQDLVREERAKGGTFKEALMRAKTRYHRPSHMDNPPHRRNDDLGEQVEHGAGLGFGAVVGVAAGLTALAWLGSLVSKWASGPVSGPSP